MAPRQRAWLPRASREVPDPSSALRHQRLRLEGPSRQLVQGDGQPTRAGPEPVSRAPESPPPHSPLTGWLPRPRRPLSVVGTGPTAQLGPPHPPSNPRPVLRLTQVTQPRRGRARLFCSGATACSSWRVPRPPHQPTLPRGAPGGPGASAAAFRTQARGCRRTSRACVLRAWGLRTQDAVSAAPWPQGEPVPSSRASASAGCGPSAQLLGTGTQPGVCAQQWPRALNLRSLGGAEGSGGSGSWTRAQPRAEALQGAPVSPRGARGAPAGHAHSVCRDCAELRLTPTLC